MNEDTKFKFWGLSPRTVSQRKKTDTKHHERDKSREDENHEVVSETDEEVDEKEIALGVYYPDN